jgi:mannan endo-1,4-beta-mannosidase
MLRRPLVAALTLVATLVLTAGAAAVSAPPSPFVTRSGADFKLAGKRFEFNGSNNYYLMYQPGVMVDDVFADAVGAGFTTIRTWGFLDIGNADGSNSVHHKENGVYFQYWDGTRPAYNDSADGLTHLDAVLAAASRAGIRLIVPLTNNWSAFGGMDQYVRWRGGQYHDDFYTDPVIRGWYSDWISHVLNRVNSLTGVAYKDDPTVMAWELANEPRCVGSGVYPASASCSAATITGWAADISAHIKAVDRNHLVGAGDEGFLCTDPASTDSLYNCGERVDSLALAKLSTVDMMSLHLYPDGWNRSVAWGTDWIRRHAALAKQIGKPSLLGEFGFLDKTTRNPVYQQWTDAAIASGIDGFLYWILSGIQADGTPYPDYDGFTVYCPSPVCTTLSNAGDELRHGQRSRDPVADHDTAQTLRDEPVTLTPVANDIAYRTRLRARSLDLDPAAAGRQDRVTVTGGAFVAAPDAAVTFTPEAGFVGRATAGYTVTDEAGRRSNVAELRVTVKPRPGDAVVIASFETGTEGWASASWQSNGGVTSSTSDFHPEGALGLHVAAADGGWFGVPSLPEPINIAGRSLLRYELRTTTAGTPTSIAVQTGPEFSWCQANFGWVNPGTVTTVEVDLATQLSCDASALADIRAVWVYVGGGGEFDLDHLRAE